MTVKLLTGMYRIKSKLDHNLQEFAKNTGVDQPAHPHSLISAFVIGFVESIICELATGEISIFWLVLVEEETCLKLLCRKPRTPVLSRQGPIVL